MLSNLLGIDSRVALIVGAGSGYGRQCALTLSEYGAKVAIASRNKSPLEEVSQKLQNDYAIFPSDVSTIAECEKLVADVIDKFGRIDIVIHAAAFLESRMPEEVDGEHWEKTLNINLRSQFFIAREAIKHMRKQKWGRIINFISTAGLSGGLPPSIIYGISKSGAVAMTKSLARQNAQHGILVNAISPASLDTPLFRRGLPNEEIELLKEKVLAMNLYGRWIEAEEVVNAVLFLASQMSSAVTGHILRADGGAELSGF